MNAEWHFAEAESETTHEVFSDCHVFSRRLLPTTQLDTCPMTKPFLTLIALTAASLSSSNPTGAQQILGGEQAGSVQIIVGPALEMVAEKSAIVRWMSTTPRGPAERFG